MLFVGDRVIVLERRIKSRLWIQSRFCKYIYSFFWLNITFFSLPCQCVYICESDLVNVWTSEICARLMIFLNRTFSNSVKSSQRLIGLNSDRGCTCVGEGRRHPVTSCQRAASAGRAATALQFHAGSHVCRVGHVPCG